MYKKVSKEITLILVMAVFLTLPLSVVPLSHAQSNKAMQDVLKIHNDERKVVGNQPLTWSDSLAAQAQAYADHLATLGIVCGPDPITQTYLCKPSPPHGASKRKLGFWRHFTGGIWRQFTGRMGSEVGRRKGGI